MHQTDIISRPFITEPNNKSRQTTPFTVFISSLIKILTSLKKNPKDLFTNLAEDIYLSKGALHFIVIVGGMSRHDALTLTEGERQVSGRQAVIECE